MKEHKELIKDDVAYLATKTGVKEVVFNGFLFVDGKRRYPKGYNNLYLYKHNAALRSQYLATKEYMKHRKWLLTQLEEINKHENDLDKTIKGYTEFKKRRYNDDGSKLEPTKVFNDLLGFGLYKEEQKQRRFEKGLMYNVDKNRKEAILYRQGLIK